MKRKMSSLPVNTAFKTLLTERDGVVIKHEGQHRRVLLHASPTQKEQTKTVHGGVVVEVER